jgi:hypothetical protein
LIWPGIVRSISSIFREALTDPTAHRVAAVVCVTRHKKSLTAAYVSSLALAIELSMSRDPCFVRPDRLA